MIDVGDSILFLRLGKACVGSCIWAERRRVPFLLRAGKCLPLTFTKIVAQKRPPALFAASSLTANALRFRISPTITIAFARNGLKPGEKLTGETVKMIAGRLPDPDDMDPYERILGDALKGDATQFARKDALEQAWRIVDPVLGAALRGRQLGTREHRRPRHAA